MRARVRAGWIVSIGVLGALGVYATLVEPNRPRIRRFAVPCPGLAAPVTALVFSDVDFPHAGAGRALVREVAAREHPDLVLVAGDEVDSVSSLRIPSIVAGAGAEIASLPAGSGRYFAPGEEESALLGAVRRGWAGLPIVIGNNDALRVATPGGPIDLFVADRRTDPAPWGVDTGGGRSALESWGRHVTSSIRYDGAGAETWEGVEITLAFYLEEPETFLDLRFGWQGGEPPDAGNGWRLIRHEYDSAFRLLPRFRGEHRATGRFASGYVPVPGVWHRARILMTDDGSATRVQARFWPERGVEPSIWLVDVVDRGPGRRHTGTIGFAGRSGLRRIADLRVRAPGGVVLLDEPFDDRTRFDASWTQASRLAAWARANASGPRLVLSHHPDVAIDLALIGARPPALVVAGHTHGGQVALPWIGPPFTSSRLPRRLASGLGAWRGVPLLVTPGLGTSVLPVRFLVPPELDLLTLTPAPRGVESSAASAGTMSGRGGER